MGAGAGVCAPWLGCGGFPAPWLWCFGGSLGRKLRVLRQSGLRGGRPSRGVQPANEAAHYALMMTYRDSGQLEKAKSEKAVLDRLQRPPEGEFTQFLKKLGEKPPPQQ